MEEIYMNKYFTFDDAQLIAEDLVSRCIHNTVKGRANCEVIPYDYRIVDAEGFCGLGISLHYDSKVGLKWELHIANEEIMEDDYNTKEDLDNMYREHSDYIAEVKAWVDYCMERVGGIESLWAELCETVAEIQLSVEEAKDKTKALFESGCFAYE